MKPTEQRTDAKAAPDAQAASDLVCFCFGITREAVLEHIGRPGSSYEQLISETGIGTKCTACRLNLEILLGNPVRFDAAAPASAKSSFWKIVNDQLNCAFWFARPEMHTVIRLANPEFPLVKDAPVTGHDWRLVLYDGSGRRVHRQRGGLEIGGDVTIDLSAISGLPGFGWFTLDIIPRAQGFVGNIRPQCLLAGKGWTVAYHAQLTKYACKRRTVLVPGGRGRFDTLFPIINVGRKPAKVTVSVRGISTGFTDSGSVEIGPYAIALMDLDELLRQPPPGELAIAAVDSNLPVRHFVMHRQKQGSYSVDHFPNTR